jgi:hypothetical protein
MNKLKRQLIRIGEKNPDLQQNLSEVLDHIENQEKDQSKTSVRGTGGGVVRDLNKVIKGNKIFTLKEKVASKIQNVLVDEGLYPKMGAVLFKSSIAKVAITCHTGRKFPDRPTEGDVSYIARKMKKRVGSMGYRVTMDSRVTDKGDVVIAIGQKMS